MAFKRICYTCGKEYEYCPTCAKYSSYPKWMFNWCSEPCKDVFDALTLYHMGEIDKNGVQDILNKHDIKSYSLFTEKIRGDLETIFAKKDQKQASVVDVVSNKKGV